MKTFYSTTIVAALLSIFTTYLQAQTTQTKLDNLELMKKWIGNWKAEIAKDTTFIIECKTFYNGYEFYLKTETKGKKLFEQKTLLGYDKKTDKLIESAINNISPEIIIMVLWYTSLNKCEEILIEDIASPDKAKYKWTYEFKSPEMFIWTDIVNNKATNNYTFHREK
jgi:hypothetical protein